MEGGYSVILVKTGEGGSWLTSSDSSLSSSKSCWNNGQEGDNDLAERSHVVGRASLGIKGRVELLKSLLSECLTTLDGKRGSFYKGWEHD